MKIKTKEAAYEEVVGIVEEQKKNGSKKFPVKQGAFWRKLMSLLSAKERKDTHFTYTEVGMEKLGKNEPALFLMNHSSFTDLQIVSEILSNRQYHIVCTNDGLVGKEKLMQKIGCIPTKKFIQDIHLIKDMLYAVEELGSSILMYPEASYSFDGTETPLPESLGKCVKLLGIPVVVIKADGAFLRDPLYNNLQKRKADVTATVTYLLSPEEIRQKKTTEINELLAEEFHYDHFRYQYENRIEINEPFRADGLHRALYKCCSCKKEGTMVGKGTTLTCTDCGAAWEMTVYGNLVKKGEIAPENPSNLLFVSDWYKWEREEVRAEIEANTYRMELDVDIMMLVDMEYIYKVGEGHLTHTPKGIQLTGCDGKIDFYQSPKTSYSLYSDYFWYEIGDVISIGDTRKQFYCFPKDQEKAIVAKARIATEEMFKM